MQEDICGAKTRSGGTCQNAPVNGSNRCRMHGGKSLKGTASPRYKHGLYSKHAGSELKEVLAELENVTSEELVQPDNEIKLMQALIMKAKALENGMDDLKDLDTVSKILDRLIHAKQRSQQIMLEQQRLVPASDIQLFLNWMEELLMNRISQDKAESIMNELQNFKISEQ